MCGNVASKVTGQFSRLVYALAKQFWQFFKIDKFILA